MAQELKEHLFVQYSELREGDELTADFAVAKSYYLKSEADKVIAELKRQIEFLKVTHDSCGDCNKCAVGMGKVFDEKAQKMQLEDDVALRRSNARHQKHKRCVAMARWCASRSASWILDPADDELHKSDFYDKWRKRWLELAEKFKEAK